MNDLFLNQGIGNSPNWPPRGARQCPGTVYFAYKAGPDMTDHVVSVGNCLCAKYGITGRVSPAVLHVTIRPIGGLPELLDDRIEAACKVAGRLVAKPFEIVSDRISRHPNGQEKLSLVAFADNGGPRRTYFGTP
jgi:2'-5' RNA ligase